MNKADLTSANLVGADLRDADLTGANLTNADLRGANFEGATIASVGSWEGAKVNWYTCWPEGFALEKHMPVLIRVSGDAVQARRSDGSGPE